ncbi:MAG: 50S ribosomal protein L25 [Candidatus Moranbacteria bacterium CG_4_10_14_3_um_filter_44_15]|nr:MAG: 50S ribosomal protein L25 [Candidatus Moranbacteria bacterium CG06_land_8_20_14_3_00_43_56]PIV83426.1 MAG: 50S ribosomal protein L25 [Candidatus Moranbacteria bacterium CG17_big_fil_post_rev_8_21_14_2_50_44_12]PIW93507.1 MAG: 50S ribosomal protein L25 [Candidatus Moranbacteria bacterium CG_4_8_14_3_um_filter_43_15]PIX90552.1 MAG: 50S ribosomal protein L25 [Candidatus Moranbacteria bacterium CG_4_10_14_3_um_filter_44_15]PJA86183.1 MAG: 50S ribosomal protein L25 [Candidatus Moranbacteria 
MTSALILDATKREKNKKKSKRDKETIPAVLYGKGIENILVRIKNKDFQDIYSQVGESTVFKLSLEGKDERNVIVKEAQRDILDGRPIHADFYQVRMDEEIEAMVEVEFIGEAPTVKDLGGVLVKNVDEIEVKCLPGDLPPKIVVDVSRLKTFDDYIYVKDLKISKKVELLIDPETVVAMVSPPRSEEELAELETEVKEDVAQVEGVVKEEKPEEEKGAEAEAKEEKEGKEKEEKGKEDEKKQ